MRDGNDAQRIERLRREMPRPLNQHPFTRFAIPLIRNVPRLPSLVDVLCGKRDKVNWQKEGF